MYILDSRFRLRRSNPSPPTFYFGPPVSKENVMYCAESRNLLPPQYQHEDPDPKNEERRYCLALDLVRDYLQRTLKVKLDLVYPLCPDDGVILSLYSNYARKMYRRGRKLDGPNAPDVTEEKLLLIMIRDELNIDQDNLAKWYWDMTHGLDYKCEYAEFNL